ncbi:competence protein CoiA [Jeotgalibacillus marinus]|uniref:Competence protein CoiA family protein n=1 Tax=Jeotgalibacillus marinus TaxID=86667 RepID=A0ABV3Q2N1_9BACL
MVYILQALNDREELVLLDGKKSRECLRSENVSTKFYCPQCHGEVRMKVGFVKIPHFSHISRSTCESFSEPESAIHLQAKQQLYEWLKGSHMVVEIEKTYCNLSQRADVSVVHEDHEYAIEFQRSQLAQEHWNHRTNGYKTHNIIPFWLLSTDCISPTLNQITLSAFHQLFIRYSEALHQFFLLTYDVQSHSFVILEHLLPLTKNKFFYTKSTYEISSLEFPQFPLTSPKLTASTLYTFRSYCARWCGDRVRYGKGQRDPLLCDFYKEKQSIQLIPPWVGLPLRQGMYLKTSPVEWQSYVFLLLRKALKRERSIHLLEAVDTITQCLNQKKLELRVMQTPAYKDKIRLVISEYFDLLGKLHIVMKENDRYMLTKNQQYTCIDHIAHKKEVYSQFWKNAAPVVIEHFNSVSEKSCKNS